MTDQASQPTQTPADVEATLRAELAEAYLALQSKLPEAGASIMFDMKTQGGMTMKFAVRAMTGPLAVDEVARTITYAIQKHKWVGITTAQYNQSSPQNPPPAPGPAQGGNPPPPPPGAAQSQQAGSPPPPPPGAVENIVALGVETISHITFNNKNTGKEGPALQVKLRNPPPQLSQYGTVLAFPGVIPEPTKKGFGGWPVGQAFAPPAGMHTVYVDLANKNKVIKFA